MGALRSHPRAEKVLSFWCVFGEARVEERLWREPAQSRFGRRKALSLSKGYLRPFPERVQVSARGKSQRLQRVLSDFGAEHSFAAGCARLQEHYGFSLNASAVRTVTLAQAARAAQTLEAAYEESFRILPAVGAETVVAEARWDDDLHARSRRRPRRGTAPAVERNAAFGGAGARLHADLLRGHFRKRRRSRAALGPLHA